MSRFHGVTLHELSTNTKHSLSRSKHSVHSRSRSQSQSRRRHGHRSSRSPSPHPNSLGTLPPNSIRSNHSDHAIPLNSNHPPPPSIAPPTASGNPLHAMNPMNSMNSIHSLNSNALNLNAPSTTSGTSGHSGHSVHSQPLSSAQSHTSGHSQHSQHSQHSNVPQPSSVPTHSIAVRPHKRKRAFKTSKHSILQTGYKLPGATNKTKYRIEKCIGKGRFSHVFSAFDESEHRHVAVKVDTNPKEKELLHQEYNIMLKFEGSPYICKVYDFGKLPKEIGIGNFLCMELCDEQNLSDQRKECPTKCFGVQKGALIGVEMMLSLREFHRKGFVHRDIKPSNFVLPQSKCWRHHLYIVDFGLSKPWNYATDGVMEQGEAEFIGTSLYASISAHKKLDLSPIDDLWSALFVIIDISTNALPWKETYILLENQSKLRRETVGKLKQQFVDYMLSKEGRDRDTSDCDGDDRMTGDGVTNDDGEGLKSGLNNNDFETRFPYQFPKEYRELFRNVSSTKYGQQPKYDELIKILRTLASNDEYTDAQYMADHAPEPVDRPIHSNFDSLQMETHVLCKAHILGQCDVMENAINHSDMIGSTQCTPSCPHGLHPTVNLEYSHHSQHDQRRTLHAPLCREYILNGKCNSNRPRGSWCNGGYHWTLNDEMHYRNHGELPLVFVGTDSLCNAALERMECREYSEQNKTCPQGLHHPTKGMQWVWNENNTFSARKPCWGQLDVEEFMEWGLYPKGVDYTRSEVTTTNFKSKLNPYVLNRFSVLLEETIFEEEDFVDEQVLEQWSKLNVSQSIAFLKRLQNVQSPQSMNDVNVRRNQLMETLKNAVNLGNNGNDRTIEDSMYRRPSQCSPYPSKQREHHLRRKAIRYPALYQKTVEKGSKFTMKVKDSRYHSSNGPSERASILQRLEEFARHSRTKPFGADVVPLLMEIPAKYAIAVLDELQQMGLRKISVVQSAIKRACDKKKPLITKETQQRKMNSDHNIHHHQRKSVSDSMSYHNHNQHHPHRGGSGTVPKMTRAVTAPNGKLLQKSSSGNHHHGGSGSNHSSSSSNNNTSSFQGLEGVGLNFLDRIQDIKHQTPMSASNSNSNTHPRKGHYGRFRGRHDRSSLHLNSTHSTHSTHSTPTPTPKTTPPVSGSNTGNNTPNHSSYNISKTKSEPFLSSQRSERSERTERGDKGQIKLERKTRFNSFKEEDVKMKDDRDRISKSVRMEMKDANSLKDALNSKDGVKGEGTNMTGNTERVKEEIEANSGNSMKPEVVGVVDRENISPRDSLSGDRVPKRHHKFVDRISSKMTPAMERMLMKDIPGPGANSYPAPKKKILAAKRKKKKKDPIKKSKKKKDRRVKSERLPRRMKKGVGSGKQRIKTPGLKSSKMEEDDEEPLIVNKRKRRNLKQRRAIDDSSDEESAKEEVDESPPITPTKMELDLENERNIIGNLAIGNGDGVGNGPGSVPSNSSDEDSEDDVPIGHQGQSRLPMNRKRKRGHSSCSSGERPSKRRKHKIEDSSSEDELMFGSDVGESYVNKTRTRRQTKEVSYADPKSDDEEAFPKVEKVQFTQHGKEFKEVHTDRVTEIGGPPPHPPPPAVDVDIDTSRLPMHLFKEENAKMDFSKLFSPENIRTSTQEYGQSITSFCLMTKEEYKRMKKEMKKSAKKEVERDLKMELCSMYLKEIDGTMLLDPNEETLCYHCKSDPKDMEWEMLLCDFCVKGAAHCSCVTPPFSSVPEGKFGCPMCVQKVMAEHQEEYVKMLDEKLAKLERRWKIQKETLSKRKDEWKAKQRKRTRKKSKHKSQQQQIAADNSQNMESIQGNREAVSTEQSVMDNKGHNVAVSGGNMNLPPMMAAQISGHSQQTMVGQMMVPHGMYVNTPQGMQFQQVQMNHLQQQQPTSFSNLPPELSSSQSSSSVSQPPSASQNKTQADKIQALLVPPAKKSRGRNKEPTYQYDQTQPIVPNNMNNMVPPNHMTPSYNVTPQQQWMQMPQQNVMYGISGLGAQPLPQTQSSVHQQMQPDQAQTQSQSQQMQSQQSQGNQSSNVSSSDLVTGGAIQLQQQHRNAPSYVPVPPSMAPPPKQTSQGNAFQSTTTTTDPGGNMFDMFQTMLSNSTPNLGNGTNNTNNPPSTTPSISVQNINVTNYTVNGNGFPHGNFIPPSINHMNAQNVPGMNPIHAHCGPPPNQMGNYNATPTNPTSITSPSQQRQQGNPRPITSSKVSSGSHIPSNVHVHPSVYHTHSHSHSNSPSHSHSHSTSQPLPPVVPPLPRVVDVDSVSSLLHPKPQQMAPMHSNAKPDGNAPAPEMDPWPKQNITIYLQQCRRGRGKRYQVQGAIENEIYPDYWESTILREMQREQSQRKK